MTTATISEYYGEIKLPLIKQILWKNILVSLHLYFTEQVNKESCQNVEKPKRIYRYLIVPHNRKAVSPTTFTKQHEMKYTKYCFIFASVMTTSRSTVGVLNAPKEKMNHLAVTLQSEVSFFVGGRKKNLLVTLIRLPVYKTTLLTSVDAFRGS